MITFKRYFQTFVLKMKLDETSYLQDLLSIKNLDFSHNAEI